MFSRITTQHQLWSFQNESHLMIPDIKFAQKLHNFYRCILYTTWNSIETRANTKRPTRPNIIMAKDTTVSRVDYGDPSPIGRKHSRRRVASPGILRRKNSHKNIKAWKIPGLFFLFRKKMEFPKSEGGVSYHDQKEFEWFYKSCNYIQ